MNNSTNITNNFVEGSEDFTSRFGFNAGPLLAMEMLLSMICLFITCYIYRKLPDLQNVPGKIVFCMCSCLFTTYLFLIMDVFVRRLNQFALCQSIGFLVHFSFLAVFLWTNVMSFDIWRTMRQMKPGVESRDDQQRRFLIYSLYAWITSFILVVVVFGCDYIEAIPEYYKPKFAKKRCWLSGTPAFLVYFNLPVGLTLITNVIFFSHTVYTLHNLKKTTKILKSKSTEGRVKLNLKLIVIMGLIWITEYLPWMTGVYKLYLVSGILTCLYGVFLFILFVCKKRIWRQVREKKLFCYGMKSIRTHSGNESNVVSSVGTQSTWYVNKSMESTLASQ